jgi:hypothetical protein
MKRANKVYYETHLYKRKEKKKGFIQPGTFEIYIVYRPCTNNNFTGRLKPRIYVECAFQTNVF